MEINRLIHFKTVYDIGSVREASTILNITPGALSKSLKVLADEVELELFIQKGRNIVPTDDGHSFYTRTQNLIKEYNLVLSKLKDPKPREKVIRLATWEVFSTYFTATLIENEFKDTSIRVLEKVPGEVERSILNNSADIGITYSPMPHKDLDILKIASFKFGIYTKSNAFKGKSLEEIPFAAPITSLPNSPSRILTLDDWPSHLNRNVKYEFEMLETALETTRRGQSAIYCPTFIAKLQNTTSRIKLVEEFLLPRSVPKTKDIYIVIRKNTKEDKVVKKVAKAIRLLTSE